MQIISPQASEHTIKVANRKYTGDLTAVIRDSYTKKTSDVSVTITKDDSFISVKFAYYVEEGGQYSIELKDSDLKPVYRGLMYATAQTDLAKYDLLKDKYQQELGFDNKFTTL